MSALPPTIEVSTSNRISRRLPRLLQNADITLIPESRTAALDAGDRSAPVLIQPPVGDPEVHTLPPVAMM